jgi:hypothetical protein
MPTPPPTDDFDEWADKVRPAYIAAAKSGARFATWQIKVAAKLPDPPKPKTDWGRFTARLRADGVLKRDGWTCTRDSSGVRRWTGTRAAREGRIA